MLHKRPLVLQPIGTEGAVSSMQRQRAPSAQFPGARPDADAVSIDVCCLGSLASLSAWGCRSAAPSLDATGTRMPNPSGCYVQVWDAPKSAGNAEYINGPVKHVHLSDLPGRRTWSNRIRSLRLGPAANATVWTDENFRGKSMRLTEVDYMQLPEEFSATIESLEITCLAPRRGWQVGNRRLPDLPAVLPSRGRRVVAILPPGGMIEVDDRVSVVGDDSVVEHQLPDVLPVLERAPLAERGAGGRAFVGYLDVERQRALRHGIARVEDVRHHLVAEIERVPWNHRLRERRRRA